MKKKVLITGALGFTAKCLIEILGGEHTIYSIDIKNNKGLVKNYFRSNLLNYNECKKIIKKIQPDYIFNLAGTFTNDYQIDYKNNVLVSKNILDSIHANKIKCKVLLIGSASEYGLVKKNDNPINESYDLSPISEYGLSKASQTILMKYFYKKNNAHVVMARSFNFINRGLSRNLLCGNLYNQIKLFKKNKIKKIELGNLDSYRDYMDIKEAVMQYIRIIKFGKPGEVYNVGSGKPTLTRTLCKKILSKEGISFSNVNEKNINKSFTNNIPIIYACIKKLNSLKL